MDSNEQKEWTQQKNLLNYRLLTLPEIIRQQMADQLNSNRLNYEFRYPIESHESDAWVSVLVLSWPMSATMSATPTPTLDWQWMQTH